MSRNVRILVAAAEEAAAAKFWYELERPGLGAKFEDALNSSLDLLEQELVPLAALPGSAGQRRITHLMLRRFLPHVLPTGFMKVRYFGLLSPSCAIPIEELRARIELASAFTMSTPRSEPVQPQPMQCPDCGGSLHYRVSIPSRRPAGTTNMTTFLHKPHASPG